MYCEHCGKKIDSDSKYCEFCGNKVKQEQKEEATPKTRKKGKNSQETKILFIILLFAIFGYIFYQELKYFNSPENAIQNFLKDWKNKNYDSILTSLNIENNKFTSSEILTKAFNDYPEISLTDYQVSSCEYDSNSKTAKCHVSYQTIKNGINYEKTYQLRKKEQNRLWIFADWTIENQDFTTINDWILFLPKDSIATLDGYELNEYRDTNNDKTGYDSYTIPNIFKGTHELEVTMNNGIKFKNTIKITSQNYTYQFTMKDVSEEFQEQVKKLGKEIIETFYQGIIDKKGKEDIESNYDISQILPSYEKIKSEIETDITLKQFEVTEIKITGLEMTEEGKIDISYQMNYKYEFEYSTNDGIKTHEGNSNDTFYITSKNAELKEIEKIDSLVTYFSKKY